VHNLGKSGDLVNVKPGYARNFLLPKGMALAATPGNMRQIELQRKTWAVREEQEVGEARKLAAQIGGLTVSIAKKVGENETLYAVIGRCGAQGLGSRSTVDPDARR
jgi:large subunit ribosomal protein L9